MFQELMLESSLEDTAQEGLQMEGPEKGPPAFNPEGE